MIEYTDLMTTMSSSATIRRYMVYVYMVESYTAKYTPRDAETEKEKVYGRVSSLIDRTQRWR